MSPVLEYTEKQYIFAASKIIESTWKFWAIHSRIVLGKLWSIPLIKLKFYNGQHQPSKRAFDTHLHSCETESLKKLLKINMNIYCFLMHFLFNDPQHHPQVKVKGVQLIYIEILFHCLDCHWLMGTNQRLNVPHWLVRTNQHLNDHYWAVLLKHQVTENVYFSAMLIKLQWTITSNDPLW